MSHHPEHYSDRVSIPLAIGLLFLSFPFSDWHTLRGLANLRDGLDIRFLICVAVFLLVFMHYLISRSPNGRSMLGKRYDEAFHEHDALSNVHCKIIYLSILLISLATFLNGVLQMGLPVYEMFYRPVYYFGLLTCPLIILATRKNSIKTVHVVIVTISIFWLCLHVLAILAPSVFLNIVESSLRNDTTRLGLNRFMFPVGVRICFMYTFLYGLQKIISDPIKSWPWILVCMLIIGDMFFVSMLRRYVVFIILLGLISIFLFTSVLKKYSILILLIITIPLFFLLFPAVYDQIIKLIDMTLNIKDDGASIRLNCFNHYWKEFELSHYIELGDFPNNRVRLSLSVYIHEQYGFYLGDLGIFSGLLKYGFQAMALTVWVYFFFMKETWLAIVDMKNMFLKDIAKTLFLLVIWQVISLEIFIWDFHYSYYWGLLLYMYYSIYKLRAEVK